MSSGIKAVQQVDKHKAHGSKRFGDATFKSPRRKRSGKVIVSHIAPQPKTDLTIKNPRCGAVHIPAIAPEDETKRIARLVPVEDVAECSTYTRYGNTRKPCDCKPGSHYHSSDERRRGMFGAHQMIAGR